MAPAVTVHTQQLGVRFENIMILETQTTEAYNKEPLSSEPETKEPAEGKKKESGRLFRDALKKLQSKPTSDSLEPKPSTSGTSSGSGNEELIGGAKRKIPQKPSKGRESWGLLKKSAVRPQKTKKATYLSKSDTVLERKSDDGTKDRRSRSASPSTGSDGRRSLKGAVENMMKERRRTKSLGQAPKRSFEEPLDVNAWEFSESGFIQFERRESEAENRGIKKYNSVDDLSPEYSGLPFVTKLKILNEKQNAAVDADSVVRSASLDVPDRPIEDDFGIIRSQSEASAIQRRRTSSEGDAAAGWAPEFQFLDELSLDCIERYLYFFKNVL